MKKEGIVKPRDPMLPSGKAKQPKTRKQLEAFKKWLTLPGNVQRGIRKIDAEISRLQQMKRRLLTLYK